MTAKGKREITSVAQLLLHAYTIEHEAEARYRDLAHQMEMHHNPEAAKLFHKLSLIEGKHAVDLAARMKDMPAPHLAPWEFSWTDFESPESVDISDVHYLMQPYHALQLALKAEQGAYRFFATLAEQAKDDDIRCLAEEFAAEEMDHIRMVKELIAGAPEPALNWDEDPDPPANPD